MTPQNKFRYILKNHLGRGYMGDVYRAFDPKNNRYVAIKFLPPQFTGEDDIKRFKQEGFITSQLDHPNIVKLYEIEEAEAECFKGTGYVPVEGSIVHFIVTEFVEGKNLREYMSENQLALIEALNIAIETAKALKEAHAKGVLHRDIKPDNIMIRPDGNVKVLDFGMAKITDWFITQQITNPEAQPIPRVITESDIAVGTATYMSPEQWGQEQRDKKKEIDERTDVWSLGVVLYEMISRRNPFIGRNREEVRMLVSLTSPPPLAKEVPRRLQEIVKKALNKDRSDRYQTIADMLQSMEKLKRKLEYQQEEREGKRKTAIIIFSIIVIAILSTLLIRSCRKPSSGGSGAASTPTPTPPVESIKSIVVVPFEATDRRDENLGKGIADSLIKRLRSIKDLNVHKSTEEELEKSGQNSRADAVLRGTIYRPNKRWDNRVRVSVTLTKGEKGVVWSETFDENNIDIFTVEDSISQKVAFELKLRVTEEQRKLLYKRYTDNVEAYRLYNDGRAAWEKRTKEGFELAIVKFKQAKEKDKGYALAYAGLADCYALLSFFSYLKPSEGYTNAKDAALEALKLDDTLAEAHASLGYVKAFYERDWAEAENHFSQAIRIRDDYATAHHWYALFLARTGHPERAEPEIRRALELEPKSPIISRSAGLLLYYRGLYDAAIEQYKKTLELDSNFAVAHIYLARAYAQKRMFKEATAEIKIAESLSPNEPSIKPTLGWVYAASGDRTGALRVIGQLKARMRKQYISPYDIALIYAGLKDVDEAFKWLDKALEENSDKLTLLKVEPMLENLHSDQRFSNLVRRVGL